MSKRNGYDEEFEGKRTSPYEDMPEEPEYEEDMIDQDESDYAYEDEAYEEDEEEAEAGFLATAKGKILLGVIAALLIVLLVLVAMMFLGKKDNQQAQQLPDSVQQTEVPVQTQAPAPIVFAPTTEPTQDPDLIAEDEAETPEPTQVPVIVVEETPAPTDEPEPTQTPLPIIMSNTPTPSPTPTASPTPSPSPSPTPSPKPTATPQVDLANGETNRDAKLRESASSSGKVKQTVKKGETVTIHEALMDKDGKVWYALTVDELATDGYMRDYVVDVDGEITVATPTPKATPEAKATPEPTDEMTVSKDTATMPEPAEDVVATGKTNRDANLRKIMNGKVLTTLRKGKTVEILSARLDKNGDVWYEVRQSGKNTVGFMRDYVVTLDQGAEIEIPEPTPAPTEEPKAEAVEEEVEETEETTEVPEQSEAAEDEVVDAIGKAKTNRDANVRVKPESGAKLVRQLTKGNALNIFGKYEDAKGQVWYEVATESGKTKGFVRDYVVNVLNIDKDAEVKTYVEETKAEDAEEKTEQAGAETVRESRFKYAGNKETKVFHELACDNLPSSSKNLVYMESRSYAVNTGYKPCENCNP